jgi:hypothetical protein
MAAVRWNILNFGDGTCDTVELVAVLGKYKISGSPCAVRNNKNVFSGGLIGFLEVPTGRER